jgi:hypothetical protein
MLRWFPRLQVAIACLSCIPPDLNFLDPYFTFIYMHNNHCQRATAHFQLNKLLILLLLHYKIRIYFRGDEHLTSHNNKIFFACMQCAICNVTSFAEIYLQYGTETWQLMTRNKNRIFNKGRRWRQQFIRNVGIHVTGYALYIQEDCNVTAKTT